MKTTPLSLRLASRPFVSPFQLILALGLATLLNSPLPSSADLIGYWNLDEGAGTTAADTSGRAAPLNGTLRNVSSGGLPTWIPARFGNGLDFNFTSLSVGNQMDIPFNADLRLNGAFTISFWYRPDYVPAASTFPGIIRIGSQSATTGTTIGWGFYRSSPNRMRFKRGNVQPDSWNPATTVGQWHHVALTYDGAGNNVAYVNGVATTFSQTWLAATSSANVEVGRMDSYDNAGLDDLALFNEAVSLAKMRSLYTVPTSLGLEYSLGRMRSLWAIFDSGPGASGVVDGVTWSYTSTLPGSTAAGDAYVSGDQWYVVLGAGAGVVAPVTLVGKISPGGIGLPGTLGYNPVPPIAPGATFIFDLGTTTTIGGGLNDLLEITGDVTLLNNTVVINPLGPLANGTYRLVNYTGAKTGSFNPVVSHNTRYSFTLDESTAGQINVTVSGNNADLKWTSLGSGSWDLSLSNWLNAATDPDRFAQGDAVRFDDTGAYQTNLNLTTVLYPAAMTVDSSSLRYTFSGIGGLSGIDGGLTKTGSSLLTLGGLNNFIGPVNLNAGTIRITSATALGATNSGTIIASGATLDLNNQTPGWEPVSVSGSGVGGAGAIVNTAGGSTADALRLVTLSDDTTFGGTGRWDLTGTLAGNGHKLTKVGPNEIWTQPSGGDTGLGDIEIQQGTIGFEGVAFPALGNPAATLTIQSNAAFAFWALNNPAAPMAKTVVMNSGIWRNNNGSNYFNGAITLNAVNTFTIGSGAALHQLGAISGPGSLTKVDAGTLVLAGANTYTGPTMVNAGALALLNDGSIGGSSNLLLASGTVLNAVPRTDGTLTLSPGQLLSGNGTVQGSVATVAGSVISPGTSAGTFTITNGLTLNDGTMLPFELSSSATEGGGLNDLINVGGPLTLNGVTTLRIVPVGNLDLVNPYTLINYGGALSGSAANFAFSNDSRISFTVDTTTTPGKVRLSVSGGAPMYLQWSGGSAAAPDAWDLRTTPNWVAAAAGELFYAGDTVTFSDSATVFNVSLIGDLYAANTLVNSAANYTFTGSGRIRGGSLLKDGGGKLTIANTGLNDYPSPTVINAGAIQLGDGGTSGSLGPAPVTNNATLILNRSDDLTFANVLVGSGTLEKQGPAVVNLPDNLSGFNGPIVVNAGTIKPLTTNGLGTPAGGTTVNVGGTLEVNGLILNREPVTVAGAGVGGYGAIVNSAGGQNNALQNVSLSGPTTFGGAARWDIRGAPSIFNVNDHALTKISSNEIWIVDAGETHMSDVFVNGGVLGIQGTTTLGDEFSAVNVASNATLGFYGLNTNILLKRAVLDNGIVRNDNGTNTFAGTVALTGSNIFTVGSSLALTEVVSGAGALTKLGSGTLILANDETYGGGTVVNGGVLQLGVNSTLGSVVGTINLLSGRVDIDRSDLYTQAFGIVGPGSMQLRTAGGLVWDGTAAVNVGGTIEVGRDRYGRLLIQGTASTTVGSLFLGNPANIPGDVIQSAGDVTVTNQLRVGHWPTEASTYLIEGGTLTLTAAPTGVVNPNAVAEQAGILYLGIDGVGVFKQTGGQVSVHGIVLDARGSTAPVNGTNSTFVLEGGTCTVGPSGIKSGNLDQNANYTIVLGHGTIASSGNWTSVLNMTITNGPTTFDTAAYTNALTGVLAGTGSLVKQGTGALVIAGTVSHDGDTTVEAGSLVVQGSLGFGFGTLAVNNGALRGTGVINDEVTLGAAGTLAPGLSIGTLTCSNTVTLGGTTLMEIDKTGPALTNDLLAGVPSLSFGGTLTVTATGDALAANDTFKLFDAAAYSGVFAAMNLPALAPGLAWDTSRLAIDGTIKVVVAVGPSLSIGLSGTGIAISWPPGFESFTLQSQTNALGIGIGSNWIDMIGAPNPFIVSPIPTNENVFFRMIQR